MTDKDTGPIRPTHGGFPREVTVKDIERAAVARIQAATSAAQKNPTKPA